MILNISEVPIYIKSGSTDMRKQINGLTIQVQEVMEKDPFSGALFMFCNRKRNLLKIIIWERNGFWLFLKRLEKDKFPWPQTVKEVREIKREEFEMLLKGIDFWKAHKTLKYSEVS
jgi:transposase